MINHFNRSPINFISAVLCAVTYFSFTVLAYALYPSPFSPARNWLSDLGNQVENPHGAPFYNAGVILTALFLAAWFTVGLSQWRLKGNTTQQILLLISQTAGILAGFGLIMSALYPINFLQVHSFWSKVHFMMFSMSFGFSVAALRYHPYITKENLYLGVCAALLPTLMFIFSNVCWLEWVAVGLFILYILSIGKSSLPFIVYGNNTPVIQPKSGDELDESRVAEIVSTWNLLNPPR